MTHISQWDNKYVAGTYKRFPVEIVSGKGSEVFDSQGKRYIDMGSGIGVTAFGIADELWQKAVCDQLSKVQHMSNLYYTSPCAELAKVLCERTGLKKVFFSNSGAEANECAVKAARKHASDIRGIDDSVIITLVNSFHGRTLTTLAATGQDHFHKLFKPLTPGFVHAKANDIDSVKELVNTHKVAAIMFECVQGEGGVLPLEKSFVLELDKLRKEHGILLIADEVQTGNGRTGRLYAYEHFGITPDIVTTAKGLGGGLPVGATLLGEAVENIFSYGDHGSTFGGNPVCCAGALSILSRIDDKLLKEVEKKSKMIFSALENAKGVKSVSGMGLMIGIETERPVADVLADCMTNSVLCLTAKTKLRLLPALNIPENILTQALDVIISACAPKED